ncbi:hypothetical protein WN51_12522 [Melipona quadrifasciata]|uniref:Uncharacterized protein n=1 Tax=Melipona quadrifasciata TaxID=166423 RepID=A0A0M9A2M9_9HYME|nr:hypothetical protein WN51_12522 [Melipona quadrifasciata]
MRLKTFYDTLGEFEPVDSVQERLNHNSTLLERFKAVQDRIIAIVAGTADEEAHEQCRDKFKNMYYRLIGEIRRRIQSSQASTTSSNARHSQLVFALSASETPLSQFHGYQGEWRRFRNRFESLMTRNASLSNLDRYFYLLFAVKGVPANALKKFLISGSFGAAWELLCERYEDDDDDDEYDELNDRHYRQQQQHRCADHRTDEVSPAKPNLLLFMLNGARDHNDVGGFLAANYGKQQQDDCITSDNEILSSSHSIDILQMQYLLKISLTLSSLLLDGEPRSRNISEQNDSGIHRVTSSENTSPYDESPQKKGTSATENQQQAYCLDGEKLMENASHSCSNLSSSKRKSSTTSESSCACLTSAKTFASLDHLISLHDPHATKHIPRLSSYFNGTNHEFVGTALHLKEGILEPAEMREFFIHAADHREDLDEERAARHRYLKEDEKQQ